MRRTRKWAYVRQEAARLAALGLAPLDIATRLSVNRSTVQRWMAGGKLSDTRRTGSGTAQVGPPSPAGTPVEWAAAVRQAYALDATDEQLVDLAREALAVAQDPHEGARVRLAAAGRFQAVVKQLALVTRPVVQEQEPSAVSVAPPVPPRPRRTDPRSTLMTLQ